jgi:hypothetical protein
MRTAGLTLATTLIVLSAGAVSAQTFPGGPGAIVLSGKCAKLVVGKLDASKGCKSELASVTGPDGTVTFIFTSEGKALGFAGDGKTIKPASNGNVRLALNLVVSGAGTTMTGQVKAAGTCTFGNPYGGKPTVIECSAESKDSTFTGSFRTDGKAPKKR